MTAEILHGKPIAQKLKAEAGREVKALRKRGVTPRVVAVHNPADPACRVYRRMQEGACRKAGILYDVREVGVGARTADVVEIIRGLNGDSAVTGLTVHLPLPEGVDTSSALHAVAPDKDIEGTHPHNLGMLQYEDHDPCPCAARAAVEIARQVHPEFKGLEAVIIGHSEMVGKTISMLLLQSKTASATPTICHIATRDLKAHTRRADLLFVAAGKAGLVRGDMIKPGATVIDIGINAGPNNTIVGDVQFDEAVEVAGRITPVPGGVGPVTLAILLRNIAACAGKTSR